MSEIKRFRFEVVETGLGCRQDFVESKSGDYILASDYDALRAERDALRAILVRQPIYTGNGGWCNLTDREIDAPLAARLAEAAEARVLELEAAKNNSRAGRW